MQKILLYYKFTPLSDPKAIMLWQKTLTSSLDLRGRILISEHGINGTVGGDVDDLKKYIKETKQLDGFKNIVFKWSDGAREDFPRMSVKVRKELVGFKNSDDEFSVDENGVIGGGKHIKPREVHELVEKYGDEVVFFDGRNAHEAKIGKFKNAVVPNTNTSRDFIAELESDKYDDIKHKKVITYCTGGIRCEVISSMMKKRGFSDVYQVDGGIVKYGEAYGDDGLWEGSLRVFDNRMTVNFSDHTATIGECTHCKDKTSNFENCAHMECNDLVLICENCKENPDLLFHTAGCKQMHAAKALVKILEITVFGNPVLRKPARQLTTHETKSNPIQTLIANIRYTNQQKQYGVGLAAPQVGKSVALSVIGIKPTPTRPNLKTFNQVIINPTYVGVGRRTAMWEGCQSSGSAGNPLFAKALRYERIKATWYDENAVFHDEVLDGFVAHVFQHETDHLAGVLFVDVVPDPITFMLASEYQKRIVEKER